MRNNFVYFDEGLLPYRSFVKRRYERFVERKNQLCGDNSFSDCFNTYLYYGLHFTGANWIIREWAPNATSIYLIGEFNNWKKYENFSFRNIGNGNWELTLDSAVLSHETLYRLVVCWEGGEGERLPSHVRRVVQDELTKQFSAQVWLPCDYVWTNSNPQKLTNPLIYEVHIGMSGEKEEVSNFNEFVDNVLPKIAELGYNSIQIMGVQEHPYYGSFGYQVSNFFAVSSRFGTPEELKYLVDCAHGYGIAVIMDLVHSHSVSNELEGLSLFDGKDDLYFHSGDRGYHPRWESRCFDYGKYETLNFLLSNCKYWLNEFRFDGFRFDGVTSMLYTDHGLDKDFTDYSMYFDEYQDEDAYIYLMLANKLIHEVAPLSTTIAEDMSGMPGLAVEIDAGGGGFDFRLSMGIADYWIKIIEEQKDEDWWMGELFFQLTNRRIDEKTISYAESHDQAMVGDKTIIFRLIDKDMYDAMDKASSSINVDRGVALHKMIRLLTLATCGSGYLNFMGNEFGHPEWIDFPRLGNNWSYHHARRLWSLSENIDLRYHYLREFDRDMIHLIGENSLLNYKPLSVVCDDEKQILIFSRASYLFVFNFSAKNSYVDYCFKSKQGKYTLQLDTDSSSYGGFDRCDSSLNHITQKRKDFSTSLSLYIPARSAQIYNREQ